MIKRNVILLSCGGHSYSYGCCYTGVIKANQYLMTWKSSSCQSCSSHFGHGLSLGVEVVRPLYLITSNDGGHSVVNVSTLTFTVALSQFDYMGDHQGQMI